MVVFCVLQLFFPMNFLLSTVLKVSVREKDGSVVSTTVRLYGPNTEYVIDRKRELQVSYDLSGEDFLDNYFIRLASN